jgi:hypothetical protein
VDPEKELSEVHQMLAETIKDLSAEERQTAHLLAEFDASDWELMIALARHTEGFVDALMLHYGLVASCKLRRPKASGATRRLQ